MGLLAAKEKRGADWKLFGCCMELILGRILQPLSRASLSGALQPPLPVLLVEVSHLVRDQSGHPRQGKCIYRTPAVAVFL